MSHSTEQNKPENAGHTHMMLTVGAAFPLLHFVRGASLSVLSVGYVAAARDPLHKS